jgi:uncharacterized membrane protein
VIKLEIRVKRNTGIMGGTSKVALEVDGKEVKRLKSNEEYVVSSDKDSVAVKVKQWCFGSNELEVRDNAAIEVKINPVCIVLLFASLVLIMISGATDALKLPLSALGVIGLIVGFFYSTKFWFKLELY